jgi:hypothetical protein
MQRVMRGNMPGVEQQPTRLIQPSPFSPNAQLATMRHKQRLLSRAGRVKDALRTLDRLDEGQHCCMLPSLILLTIQYKAGGEMSSSIERPSLHYSHEGLDKMKISVYTPSYERTLTSTECHSIG